jgi:hypothetical protein
MTIAAHVEFHLWQVIVATVMLPIIGVMASELTRAYFRSRR